jgi:hypothetical protein
MGRWLAAAIWTAILFAASSDLFSSSHTGGLLATLLGGYVSPEAFDWIHRVLRKAGHLTGYGIASVLYYKALVDGGRWTVDEAPEPERQDRETRDGVPGPPSTVNRPPVAGSKMRVANAPQPERGEPGARDGVPRPPSTVNRPRFLATVDRAPVAGSDASVAKAGWSDHQDRGTRDTVPRPPATGNRQPVRVALLLVLAVASLDEWHQSTIPSRTGTPVDVLIDLTGGTIAQLWLRVEWRRRANC